MAHFGKSHLLRSQAFGWTLLAPLLIATSIGCVRQTPSSGDVRTQRSLLSEPASSLTRKSIVQIGHPHRLRHVVFSTDGTRLLTSSRDVILWDVVSGDKLLTFAGETHGLSPLFCLEDTAVVIGGNLYDTATGALRQTLLDSTQAPSDQTPSTQAIDERGERLIVGTKQGEVRVVELSSGKLVASLSTEERETIGGPSFSTRMLDVGFSAVGEPLAMLVGGDRRVSVWNVASKSLRCTFKPPYFYRGKLSSHGNFVVLLWDDLSDGFETLAVYDAISGDNLTEWTTPMSTWNALDGILFLPDGQRFVARSDNKQAVLWDAKTNQAVHTFEGHKQAILAMELRDAGSTLRTRSQDVTQDWDLASGKLQQTMLAVEEGAVSDVTDLRKASQSQSRLSLFSPDGRTILCGQGLYDAVSERRLRVLKPSLSSHAASFRTPRLWPTGQASYSPDGRRLVVSWKDNSRWSLTSLFDVATGESICDLAHAPEKTRYHLQWSRDGRRAINSCEGLHRLWDVERGSKLQTIGRTAARTNYQLSKIAFSENGKFVYTHAEHCGLFFWDAETGQALHHQPPGELAANERGWIVGRRRYDYYRGFSSLSPDRRQAVSWYNVAPTTSRHDLLVWDIEQAKLIRRLNHAPLIPLTMRYSADGERLAVYCSDRDERRIVVWDMNSLQPMYSLDPKMKPYSHYPDYRFALDEKLLLIEADERCCSVYQAETGRLLYRLSDPVPPTAGESPRKLRELVLSGPADRYALADFGGRSVVVWDLQAGRPCLNVLRRTASYSAESYFQFSDDGQQLLTRHDPPTLWDLATGKQRIFPAHRTLPQLPGFPPRRPRWTRDTFESSGVPQRVLDRFQEQIPATARAAETTPDGRRLIIHHDDSRMAIWEIGTGQLLLHCYQLDHGSSWLTVTPEGRSFGSREYVRYRAEG